MRIRWTVVGAIALTLVGGGGVRAVQDADATELAAYRLTKDTLDRYAVVMKTLVVEMAKDPRFQEMRRIQSEIGRLTSKDELTAADEKRLDELEARLERLEDATDLSLSDGSLSNFEARIRRDRAMMAALEAGGMTPREYATFTVVLAQASIAVGMRRAGLLKEMPKEISAENLQFVEAHAGELDALRKQMEALAAGGRER